MYIHKQGKERRKEPRFNINMQASIQPERPEDSRLCRATLENISLHGLRSNTDELLSSGQEVLVKYTHAQSGREVMLFGRIKWLVRDKKKYKAGIELYQKNVCNLTLEQASTLPSLPLAPNSLSWPYTNSLQTPPDWQDYYQSELYWGYFFKTFQDHIQKNLILISSSLNMSITHLESILHRVAKSSYSPMQKNQLQHHLGLLERANLQLMQLVKLFQILQEENISNARAMRENKPELISMGAQLKKRVDSFQEKLNCLAKTEDKKIVFQQESTSLRSGSLWRINYGLDFLLLHSYQFILFENASCINIKIMEKEGNIYIEIIHDGSGIFSGDKKEVILNKKQTIKENIHIRDKLNIVWFYHILDYLKELNASIFVKSDSGSNVIILRM